MLQKGAIAKQADTSRGAVFYHPEFGDDETGNGTPRYPYRTYEGAVRGLPLLIEKPIAIRNLDNV